MLGGVPLGVYIVLIIKALFFGNRYAREYLDIVNIL
jgi:hypothetical protein